MNIKQISLAVALALALSFISVVGYKLNELYTVKLESITAEESSAASSVLNEAIIELSLERSVMQVTLNLEPPIQPQFRDLIDQQRDKSTDGFERVLALLAENDFRRADEFTAQLAANRHIIDNIRGRADQSLAVGASDRDPAEVENLAAEMKEIILLLSQLPLILKPEAVAVPSKMTSLQTIQHAAWAIREFGGRERTYMAIATATGRPFTGTLLEIMADYHAQAVTAMETLDILSRNAELQENVKDSIQEVRDVYFGTYERTRQSLITASATGTAYPLTFQEFFTESSIALDTAVSLSYLAGDEMLVFMGDAQSAAERELWLFVGVLVIVILLCGYQIYFTQVRVSGRILSIAGFMSQLSQDKTDFDISPLQGGDEIGQMADAVEVFRQNTLHMYAMEEEKRHQQIQADNNKTKALKDMASKVAEEARKAVSHVSDQVSQLTAFAADMNQKTIVISRESDNINVASEETLKNSEAVAAASDEMSASIKSIADQVSRQEAISKTAETEMDVTSTKMKDLTEASQAISQVVELISEIAAQTNLLALNATIEAARAGEAGKGFAVVASEVKNLSSQTTKATENIERQISRIQAETIACVRAISDVRRTIISSSEISQEVAHAIQQQNQATLEINSNVIDATEATRGVSNQIDDISAQAAETRTLSDQLKSLAESVEEKILDLERSINEVIRTSAPEVDRRE